MNPINKALNDIKKYQEPNGPITGYPIFADSKTFNQEFLSQRFHTLDSQKDTVKLQKQFERANSTQMMIDPRIPQQDSLHRVYNPNSKPTSGDYT